MTKLKSFGCSFIYGSELSDELLNDPSKYYQPPTHSKLTWPAHLAQHLNYNYLCYARPGSGNLQIADQVLSHLATNEQALFIINWTFIDRFDYVDINNPTKSWPDQWVAWSTLMPIDETDIAKTYYKNLHSEIRDKLTTLMSIKLVLDTLQQKNCPFIMTYIDDLMFDKQWHTTPAITDMQDYILPHMTTFDGLNLQQWTKKNGYPITSIGHPLEQAHAAAGKLMIKVFDTQNTNVR
jgi:hypothetical protein